MFVTACVCWVALAIVTVIQLRWHNIFVSIYRQKHTPFAEEDLPKTGVIMTLRGADPFLPKCLRGLFTQDHPRHEIRIIVDSEEDPAMAMVQQVKDEVQPDNVTIEVLRDPPEDCSLRMSSLLQGVAGFSDDVEVIAWLDADALPYEGWLRDLITPLSDPKVGAASGVRWYMPADSRVGTLARHIWNAAAFLQMSANRIGWGGSFAIRKSVFEECNIREKWSKIMFEDAFTSNCVTAAGHDLRYAGPVTMMNSETTSFAGCLKFVVRQKFNCRLYHRAWKGIVAFGLFWMMALLGNLGMLIWSAATQNWTFFAATAGAWGVHILVMTYMLLHSELHIRRHVKAQGLIPQRISFFLLPAGLIAHVLLPLGLWFAWRTREIEWRGIRYKVPAPNDVERLNYEPFRPAQEEAAAPSSL